MNFDEGYPTGLAAVLVQTALLVVMAAMAPMKSVAGTAVGVAVSTLVAAGVAVVSAKAAKPAVIMITNRTSLIL